LVTGRLKKAGMKPLLLAAIIMIAILLSGCTGLFSDARDLFTKSSDPVLRRAGPYIAPIETENATIRAMAASAVSGGPAADKEYEVDHVYRYIVEKYSYYSDPRGREYIQTPAETIAIGGGDCEDLTILLCSLLENLGIRTYLVLTPDHAYCLASGIDVGKLGGYAKQSLLEQIARDYNNKSGDSSMVARGDDLFTYKEDRETSTLPGGFVWYFGGNGSKLESPLRSITLEYEITSSAPVSVYCVPSEADYTALVQDRRFNFYPSTEAHNILSLSDSCADMATSGGLVIKNDGRSAASISVHIKKFTYYNTSALVRDMPMVSYVLNNQTCVVLDPTAGKYGYPGFSSYNETGERIAIDPVTKQYYYLSNKAN
jgi:hypothetical protein